MKNYLLLSILIFIVLISIPSCTQKEYTPDWESLSGYETPDWFRDAKFGIFIHWGVYSVPAYVNEWYPRNMYRKGSKQNVYHLETYGSLKEFGYKDFIPQFKAEKWNPTVWAKLFKESGAKYVVPVAEHHDGFPMYDCSYTKYNAMNMGPERDLIGELLGECRQLGLKAGVSSHRAFNWEFYAQEEEYDTWDSAFEELYWKRRTQRWPDEAFVKDWYLRTNELVTKYKPDLVWFDFYLDQPEFHDVRYQLAADYFNMSKDWGKDVVLQYKYDIYHPKVGLLDIERGKLSGIRKLPWQTDTSVGFRGWSYIQNPEYKPVGLLIDDLVDIVSKNGNLLLNIGPKPDGTIPDQDQTILREIGKWLSINGESIYGTRPWVMFGEGPSKTAEGAHQERKNKGGTSKDYRFTTKGNTLYATCMDWPDEDFNMASLGLDSTSKFEIKIQNITMLGSESPVDWKQSKESLTITLPDKKPCDHAFVFRIETKGLVKQMNEYGKSLPEDPETIYCFPGNSLREGDGYNVRDGKLNQWEKDVTLRWNVNARQAGTYEVKSLQQNQQGEHYILTINNQVYKNPGELTGREFSDLNLGRVNFENPGNYELTMMSSDKSEWHGRLQIKQIRLIKE